MRRVAAALAVAALAVTAACSGGDDRPAATNASGRALTGTFTVTVQEPTSDPCGALPDHPDLIDGAAVVVSDTEGRELLSGSLGNGTVEGSACTRSLALGVVAEQPVYRISVGSYGPIEVTAESLDESGGTLDLRLGV